MYQLEKPVKNYQITAKDYPKYIDCEQLMNDVSSAKVSYAQVQDCMTEQVYNALSGKTKSWYTEKGEIYDTEIKVINEQLDTKIHRLFISNCFTFSNHRQNTKAVYGTPKYLPLKTKTHGNFLNTQKPFPCRL